MRHPLVARSAATAATLLLLFVATGTGTPLPSREGTVQVQNLKPVVDAGPDQTITLPATATLVGTATDDGLPAGSTLTFKWRVDNGRGVTFSDDSSLSTTATFTRAGTYVFRLTATDGKFQGIDTVKVIVRPGPPKNAAPIVHAGPDQTITLPATTTLVGAATDDGLPTGSTLTTQWTVDSGGAVTFANAAAPSTTATFGQAGTYVLRLAAGDGALSSFDTLTVIVEPEPPPPPPQNQAPTASAGADLTITLPSTAMLAGTATDDGLPTGSTLTTQWTVDSGGAVTFVNAAALSTTATFAQAGTYVLRLAASDGELSSFDTLTVIVEPEPPPPPQNQAPTVNAGPDQTITLPNTATLAGTATDDGVPTGSTLTTTWSVDSGGVVTFVNAAALSTTATFAQAGTYVLRLTATDGELSSFDTLTVIVEAEPPPPPQNQAPTVNAGGDQIVTLPNGASLNGAATDDGRPAGSALTVQWSVESGAVATFTNATQRSTTATFAQAGTYVLRLTASDGELSSSDTITVIVNPAPIQNMAPTANAGPDQVITLPNQASLSGVAGDDGNPAGSTVITQWTRDSGPAPVVFTNAAAAATSAAFTTPGTYVLRFAASDGPLSAFDTLTIVVSPAPLPVNLPPSVTAGPDLAITFPTNQVSLAGSASDAGQPPGSLLATAWTKDSGPGSVTFGSASAAATTATFDQPGTYVLRLTAADGVHSVFDTVSVVVHAAANLAPLVTAGPDQVITLPSSQIALSGAATDDGLPAGAAIAFRWSVVSGPTVPTFGDALSRETPATFTIAGTYVLRLTATDGDRSAFDDLMVLVNAGAPPPPVNRNPAAHAGGPYTGDATSALGLSAAASTDPDGDALTYQWTFGDGQNGSGRTPVHAWAEAGTFTVSVTVSDGRGGVATASTQATIGPPLDRAPPSVQLRAPTRVLPGEQFIATAEAADNVAVTVVTFEVNGANPTETTVAPYQHTVTAPPLASPGTIIAIRATARDARGNAGSALANVLVTAAPDTEPPTLQLQAPADTAAGSQVLVTALATDNVGVDSVSFALATQALGVDPQPSYEARYDVPAGTAVGTTLTFTARARDLAGNSTDRAVSVNVIAAPDLTPPTIALSAPAETAPGATITVNAAVNDNSGVAGVQFFADDVPLVVDAAPPYTITVPVAADRTDGSVIRTRAVATDFAGLTATSTAETVIRTRTAGAGMVFGEVYDDTTGLPIAAVVAHLDGTALDGASYTATATTDARGRYVVQGREGTARITLSRAGWTSVVRSVAVPGNRAIEALDARLTPVAGQLQVDAVLGRSFQTIDLRVDVPGGALAADTTLHVTRVSAQGLAALLPLGWSPVAAIDLAPHGLDLSSAATLSARKTSPLAETTSLAVIAWDDEAHGWRVIATTTAGTPEVMLATTLTRTAAIVWAVADQMPAAPPAAVVGDLLAGVDVSSALGPDDTVQVTPQPNVIVYQPGVRSQVGGQLSAATPVSSGHLLRADLREHYEFFSGDTTAPDPFQQDLVLYQFPGTATSLSASFVVSPSLVFESAFLRQGVIGVEIVERAPAAEIVVIDATGGTATSPTGESITVPPGALTTGVPTVVSRLAEPDLGIQLVAPLQFVAGATVSFSGALLTQPATLSAPRPAGIVNDDGLVLLRIAEIDGASRLLLVGLGRIAGEQIVSDTAVPGILTPLEGVRAGGRYVFARVAAPFGFATGVVRGVSGVPFAGAIVSASTLPTIAISQPGGQYVAIALSGPIALQALDVARRDAGFGSGVLTGGGILRVDLSIALDPPRVTSVTPAAGAIGVPPGAPIVVSFSEPIDPASVGAFRVEAGGTLVPGAIALSDSNRIATFRALEPLLSATAYTVRVTTALADLSGRTLASEFTSTFTSLDTAPPPPPPAGAITASIPGTDGLTTVSSTQGSAGLHDTVDVLNVTRNTSTRALVNPNGSFSTVVAASLGDRLQVIFTSQGGGQTIAPVPAFAQSNPDGSRSVVANSAGGRLEGPAGIVVDVPPGALPDGTLVTMRPVDEASFPIPLTAQQRELFAFSGGVALDFNGAVPSQYLNVSIPASPGDRQTDRWVVGAVQQVNGRLLLNAIDTARVINGQIQTASPPCPGVQAAATYGYIKSTTQPIGVVYGQASGGDSSYSYGIEIVNPFTTQPLVLPWSTYNNSPTPQPTCFPILMSRTTVTPNAQRIAIQSDQFHPTSREIHVHNLTSGARLNFPRNVVEHKFLVGGTDDDVYQTLVITPAGEQQVPHEISPATLGFVVIRLDMDAVFNFVTEIVIRNLSRTPATETRIAPEATEVEVPVPGGASDTYDVFIRDSEGGDSVPPFELRSPGGAGNLVARVLPVTIDPGTDVVLINATQGSETTVPEDFRADGGLTYPFSASVTDRFGLRVDYHDGRTSDLVGIPAVRIVVRSGETGRVMRIIEAPVPPIDEPFFNLGAIDGDVTPPTLLETPTLLTNFDPAAALSFRFSEGIDRLSARDGVTLTQNGQPVAGEVRLSQGNTVVTFVPNAPLKLGATFVLRMQALKDASGNEVEPVELTLTTFAPAKVAAAHGAGSIQGTVRDIAFLSVPRAGGGQNRYGYALIDDGDVAYLVTLDMNDPDNPVQLSNRLGGNSRVEVVTGIVNLALRAPSDCGGASVYSGNLAITTNYTNVGSAVQFWDLSNPVEPCMMGSKLLTVNPAFAGPNPGAIQGTGRARRPVAVKTTNGLVVYIAVEEIGLMMVDVGANSPRATDSVREPFAAGNYTDVIDTGSVLIVAERTQGRIDFLDTSLTMLQQMSLSAGGASTAELLSLAYAPGWGIDDNQNGFIDAQEVHNLLFVGASGGIGVIDITDIDLPRLLSVIPMQGPVFKIAVDVDRRRIYAAGVRVLHGNDWAISMIDLGAVNAFVARDENADHLDDRVIWQTPEGYRQLRHGYRALALDAEQGALFVGLESAPDALGGIDVWNIINVCCDLLIDVMTEVELGDDGDKETLLMRERRALQTGVAAGLAAAQACGVPIRVSLPITPNSISIIEQGSGACLWKDNPLVDCGSTYQPGLSDHDYEVFIPNQYLPGDDTSGGVCVIKALNAVFTDPVTKKPRDIDLGNGLTMRFDDITFFPVSKERFESARLDVDPPRSTEGDTTGDMGLGRQQLLLKWVLEGEYVFLPGWHVIGRPLEEVMTELRLVTRILPLEGFEWGVLQRFALAKSKAFLRIRGSSDPLSSFHELYVSQLHDAGKAGIRTTLARMVADPAAADVVLNVSRSAYGSDACLAIVPGARTPTGTPYWPNKKCEGFEDYVASAAGHTVLAGLPIFTVDEIENLVHRFYRVKADKEQITDEAVADQFIAATARFVDGVITATLPVYESFIGVDPEATQRQSNRDAAIAQTGSVLTAAKLQVVPRALHLGFVGISEIQVSMFRGRPGDAAGSEVKSVRISLQANENKFLERGGDVLPEPADGLSEEDRNLIDLGSGTDSSKDPLFMLGKGGNNNPPINLTAEHGVARYVAFTIDLPEKRAREANRLNNFGGFFYYVLNRETGLSDSTPPSVPLPLPDLNNDLLLPDETCQAPNNLEVSQVALLPDPDDPASTLEFTDVVVVDPGSQLTFRETVSNTSEEDVDTVESCNSLLHGSERCQNAGTLSPGEDHTREFTYTVPSDVQYIDSLPTAFAPRTGIRKGNVIRIVVACDPITIVPAPGNPNPTEGPAVKVMRGGEALRHFRVINSRTGQPMPGIDVVVEVTTVGRGVETLTFFSDETGRLVTEGEESMVIPVDADLPVDTVITGSILSIDGEGSFCQSNYDLFRIEVSDRTWTRRWQVGSAINVKASLEVGVTRQSGSGLSFGINESSIHGRQKLTVGRSTSTAVGVIETIGKTEGTFQLFGATAQAGAKVEAGLTGVTTYTDNHEFSFPQGQTALPPSDSAVLGGLLLSSLASDEPIIRMLLEAANPIVDTGPFKTSETFLAGVEVAVMGNASLLLGWKENPSSPGGSGVDDIGRPMVYGLEAGLNGSLQIGANLSATESFAKRELTPAVELKGSANLTAGLTVGDGEIPKPKPNASEEEKKKEKMLKFTDKLRLALRGTVAFGAKVSETFDLAADLKPKKLTIALSSNKGYGWQLAGTVGTGGDDSYTNANGGSEGAKTTFEITFTDEATIRKVAQQLAIVGVMHAAMVTTSFIGPSTPPLLGQTLFAQEVVKLVELIMDSDATFAVQEERGQGVSLQTGFDVAIAGVNLALSATPAADRAVTYTAETGVISGGSTYGLARYPRELFPTFGGVFDDFTEIGKLAARGLVGLGSAAVDVVSREFQELLNSIRSRLTAQLDFNGAGNAPFTPAIASWRYEVAPTATGFRIQRPSDYRGPAGPHYGVGGFHQFLPRNQVLATPGTLTFFYNDDEVEGIDESQLAIYRWNAERRDWDLVGGTADPAANTVTTTVDRLALYTTAPAMPSGTITLASTFTPGGTDQDPTTTVTYTTDTLRLNTGGVVPDGTLYTVTGAQAAEVFVPYGTVLEADADPAIPGTQVAATGGMLQFTVVYPAASGGVRPLVFSREGTALASALLQLRQ